MAGGNDVRAGRAFVELYVRNSLLVKGLNDVSARMKKLGTEMASIGGQMLRVGLAAGVPFGLAIKQFADFDDAMRAVKGVTQATGDDFDRLTKKARDLGASTSFTAVQVANLMVELGRAGFSPTQIEDMTGAVLDLSRATGTDATLSAGIMAASLRQYGLGASEAVRVSDALTVAANKSFNSVESLGEALGYAGPVAADMGMSIEDTLAILGGLGNVGIQGSEAGTALRRLSVLTAADAERLKGIFGVTFKDAAGNARPLIETLGEVFEATKNLGTANRAAKFSDAFGLLGITSASSISKNVASIKELRAELGNASGVAAKTAKEMDAGLGGSFRIILSAVEGFAIAIGEAVDGSLRPLIDEATVWISAAGKWVSQNKQIVATIAAVVAGVILVGGALTGAGFLLIGIGSAIGSVMAIVGGLGTLLMATFSFAISPLGLLTIAILSSSTAMKALGDVVASIGGFFTPLLDEANHVFSELSTVFGDTWQGMQDAISGGNFGLAMEIAFAGLNVAWQVVVDEFNQIWIAAINGIDNIWLDFQMGFMEAWEGTMTFVGETWRNLQTSIAQGMFSLNSLNAGGEKDNGNERLRGNVLEDERKAVLAKTDAYLKEKTGGKMGVEYKKNDTFMDTYDAMGAETKAKNAALREASGKRLADARAATETERGFSNQGADVLRSESQKKLDAAKAELAAASERAQAAKLQKAGDDELDQWFADVFKGGDKQGGNASGFPNTSALAGAASSATFSGSALAAMGQGGGPQAKILAANERMAKLMADSVLQGKDVIKELGKISLQGRA